MGILNIRIKCLGMHRLSKYWRIYKTVKSNVCKNAIFLGGLTTNWDVNLGACSNFPFSTQPNVTKDDASPKAFLAVHEYLPASEIDNFSISKMTIPKECIVLNLEPETMCGEFKYKDCKISIFQINSFLCHSTYSLVQVFRL